MLLSILDSSIILSKQFLERESEAKPGKVDAPHMFLKYQRRQYCVDQIELLII